MSEQKEVNMGEEKQKNETSMSLSKERKLARKKEIQQMKRNAIISKVVSICVVAVLVIGIGSFVGYKIYRSITKITPDSDYSATLLENGFIDGVDASSLVSLPDYKNATVALSEVEYSDESVEADIKKMLATHATKETKTDAVIEKDTKINMDYVGSIDGEEFSGGSTQGKGTDYTMGSDKLIDNFEDQLLGHKVGDKFTVNVTFPEDYSNTDVAGKDAVFEVVINAIYVNPEFTDAFIKENYKEVASTTAEYRAYIKDSKYQENLTAWIQKYLVDNSSVSSYPETYLKRLKSLQKYQDIQLYEYMNAMYAENGYQPFKSFSDYVEMSEAKYDKSLTEKVEPIAKEDLIYQAIIEAENVTVTEADYLAYLQGQGQTSEEFDKQVEQYGKPYLMQHMMKIKVIDIIKEYVKVQ